MKLHAAAIVAFLASLLLLPSCSKWGENKKQDEADDVKEVPLVRVAPLRRTKLDRTLEVTGVVEAVTYVTVNPRIEDASILELKADVGNRVAAGDILALFDPTDARMLVDEVRVAQAEASVRLKDAEIAVRDLHAQARAQQLTLDQAERALDRAKAQAEKGAIAQEALDAFVYRRDSELSQKERLAIQTEKAVVAVEIARMAVDKAALALARAERKLAWATLRSPIDGVVSRRQATVGQETLFTSFQRGALFEIFDPASLVVNAQITQRDLPFVNVGLSVEVRAEAVPNVVFAGTISVVSPIIEPVAGTISIRIAIKENEKLKPGLFASGRVVLEAHPNTLVVPKKAVLYERERPYVMKVAVEPGKTRVTRVFFKEGLSGKEEVEILTDPGALADTDRIVLVGHDRLRDGDDVRVEKRAGEAESKPGAAANGG